MGRNWLLGALVAAALAGGWLVCKGPWSAARNPQAVAAEPEGKAPERAKEADSPLPIKQVVLFNSGLGFFQREGEVAGDMRVDLRFPASDVDDLLKSLVLQDLGGGRVTSVNYDSHDPIERILRSFALDLNNNPTFGQILNQARGEKIEVSVKANKDAPVAKVAGVIVGMETQARIGTAEAEVLNLTAANGLQSIPLSQVLAVKFLNPALEQEFHRALQVLARAHDVHKKSVSLGFSGAGKRAVRVGYVVERPIWKTTYRLRLEPNGKIFLQGWALVENTSDDDWTDVRMALVAGKPIAFQMNLYEPLYVPRPVVEPELFASLRPPVYNGALDAIVPMPGPPADNGAGMGGQLGMMGAGGPPNPNGYGSFGQQNFFNPFAQFGQLGGGQFGQFGQFGYQGGGNAGNFMGFPSGFQGGAFQGGVNGIAGPVNRFQVQRGPYTLTARNKLTYEELRQRRLQKLEELAQAKAAGAKITALNFKEGIQSVAAAEEVGDYFQYVIDHKVSLPRQKSAMLPILDQTIEGTKVSIFNEAVHAKHPLLGLRLKNTSGKPLTQGPITVYDNQTYAGDTRTLDLQPNEERLLSYAMDQGTEVKKEVKTLPAPEMHLRISDQKLTGSYKLRQTTTYIVKNRSTHDRTVLLEHPSRAAWKLIEPQPAEKTRDEVRFSVDVAPGKTVAFNVTEEQPQPLDVALSPKDSGPARFALGHGVEIVPVSQETLGDKLELKLVQKELHARHMVREIRTYFVHNHSGADRTFHLMHLVRPGWRLIQANPAADASGPKYQRVTLTVPAGKTLSQQVVEEKLRVDVFPIKYDLDQPAAAGRFVLALGLEVQPIEERAAEQLVDLKLVKGMLQARYRARETTTYMLKNNLEQERLFMIDHMVRPSYKRVVGKNAVQDGPGVHRLEMKVAAGGTAQSAVVEERIYGAKGTPLLAFVQYSSANEEELFKFYLGSPAVAAPVKAAILKVKAQADKIAETAKRLNDADKQLSTINQDQSRLRSNLQVIPQSSEHYKKFLEKFVTQEASIETLQAQVRTLTAEWETQRRDLEAHVNKLDQE